MPQSLPHWSAHSIDYACTAVFPLCRPPFHANGLVRCWTGGVLIPQCVPVTTGKDRSLSPYSLPLGECGIISLKYDRNGVFAYKCLYPSQNNNSPWHSSVHSTRRLCHLVSNQPAVNKHSEDSSFGGMARKTESHRKSRSPTHIVHDNSAKPVHVIMLS